MSDSHETDRDQWSAINRIREAMTAHEKECALWRGGMNVKVNTLLWLVGTCTVAFATAGAAHFLPKIFGG